MIEYNKWVPPCNSIYRYRIRSSKAEGQWKTRWNTGHLIVNEYFPSGYFYKSIVAPDASVHGWAFSGIVERDQ